MPIANSPSGRISRLRTIRKYILVVTTGRSGSTFFTDLINVNARNAFSEHEANVVSGNQSTEWFYAGNEAGIASIIDRKLARLRRGEMLAALPFGARLHGLLAKSRIGGRFPRHSVKEIYVEVDNGSLKSWGPALLKAVPYLQVVHLTRDPLLQAKSAENRGSGPNPDRPYFLWPAWKRNLLPLDEAVVARLTPFQLALWYWIEMEVRYTAFFRDSRSAPNMEFDVEDLNETDKVHEILDRLGIEYGPIALEGNRNAGQKKSLLSETDRDQARALLALLPAGTLDRISNTYGLERL